jgi:glutamate carboxypeptidase
MTSTLLEFYKDRNQQMIDLLTELVNIESPSRDKGAVDVMVDYVESQLRQLAPSSVTRQPQTAVGDCLLAKWIESGPGKPILILMHLDTVWSLGTISERPVRLDDEGRLYGPGAVDMKGGVTVALSAIRGLLDRGELPDRPIWMFFNTDEEIGSKHSTETIRELAAQCGLVLVMEPGTSDGAIKTQRKGIATYRVSVEGRASHAGNEPEAGINAIVELAQQVHKLNGLNDLRNGTSVSVTMIEGGTAGNVIPAHASAYVDTRMITKQAMDQIREQIMALTPFVPGAKVSVELLHARGPMEFNEQMRATFNRCKAIATEYGLTVRGESVGGGSDGNTTASMGIPTLDGLGPYGGGLHAIHEHVLISSLAQRTALLSALLLEWPHMEG